MSWIAIIFYLLLQLAIGWWVSKRIKTEKDYFIAGRNLPLPMVAVSLFATWYGAETCIGSAGAVYAEGLSGSRADPFGYALCLFFMGMFLATRLWRGGFMTLGDFFRERFGVKVERLAVWIILPSSVIWGAAQVRAFGQVISATTDLDVTLAIALATGFVVAYTFLGGLLGDIVTDILQGGILCLGLLLLLYFTFDKVGDFGAVVQTMDAARLSFFKSDGSILVQLDRWMVPILGSLVAQELISRVLAAKSASIARRASFAACGIYLALGCVPVVLGLIGPTLIPELAHQEEYLITLAEQLMPPIMYVVFAGALISAILSTVDSIMLSISALLSHNFLVPVLKISSERGKMLCARAVVVAAGIVSYVLAITAESVYGLVEEASSFGTAGVLITTIAGLHSSIGHSASAIAALITGLVVTPLGRYVLDWEAPFIMSIGCALVAYLVFAFPLMVAAEAPAGTRRS